MGTVSYALYDRAAVITIDRPHVRNAVDARTATELAAAFERFAADDDADVAILRGAGDTFCAGYDLGSFESIPQELSPTGTAPMGPSRMVLPKPVIAAVEGYAVAGGLELALLCDLRVVASDAVFGVFCRRFGVPLVDLGTIRLPRIVGHGRAMDLILTGRAVDADEALAIGLATRIVTPGHTLDAALELARSLSAFPQAALRNDRLSAIEQWDLAFDAAVANEVRRGNATLASGEASGGAFRARGREARHEHRLTCEWEAREHPERVRIPELLPGVDRSVPSRHRLFTAGLFVLSFAAPVVANAATPVDLSLPPAPSATAIPASSDMTSGDRAIASHFTAKKRARARTKDWILTGFLSKHFSEDRLENDKNSGVFFEHDVSRQWGVYLGEYSNSGRIRSHLIAALWQPMHIGPVRVGFEGGVVDGYMQLNRGHFAPAALPFLSYTMGFVKANLFCIPPVIKTAAPVCSLQFGASLEDLTEFATRLRASHAS